MGDEQFFLKWDSHHTTFNDVISRLRYKEFYTDVTLACNGKLYPLHKLVLSICSEYFSEIFEINECTNTMVILTDIQCSDIELLLDYMYTGELNVRKDDMASLFKAAEFLRIKSLAIHYEAPKSSSCSNMSEIRSPPLEREITDNDRSTDLIPGRSCQSPMQNVESYNKQGEGYPLQKNCVENSKGSEGIFPKNEEEDVSGTKLDSSIDFPDLLQTIIEEDNPLSLSDCDDSASDLAGTSGIENYTNSFWVRDNNGFTESLSGVVAEKCSPPSKKRRTGEDRYTGVIPSKPSTSLIEDPKCADNINTLLNQSIPEAPIEPVTSVIENNTNPSLVKDNSGFTESLYVAVSEKHTILSLASPNAPIEPVIEFFREKCVLKKQMFCEHCKTSMKYCKDNRKNSCPDGYIWKCYYDACKKRYTPKSIREGSPFHKGKITLKQWLHLLHQYTCGTGVSNVAKILGITRQTVGPAYAIIRKLFSEQFEQNPSELSDPGIVVEMEESLSMSTAIE